MSRHLLRDSAVEAAPGLWVGSLASGVSPPEGVRAMLSVCTDEFETDATGLVWLRLPVLDGPGFDKKHMDAAIRFLETVHAPYGLGLPTLVHCQAGLSRSVAVVATFLHLRGEPGYDDLQNAMTDLALKRGGGRQNEPVPHMRRVAECYAEDIPLS